MLRSLDGNRLSPLTIQDRLPKAGMGTARNDSAAPTKQENQCRCPINIRGWGRNAFQRTHFDMGHGEAE
jgi:hypothetical protein